MGGRRSRKVLLACTATAGVLAMSSSAWACAALIGKMTVVGNVSSTAVVTTVGRHVDSQGQFAHMEVCPGFPKGKAKATLGGTVTVTMRKAGLDGDGCVPRSSKMDPGTYDVNYINGRAFLRSDKQDKDSSDGSRTWERDCMSDPGNLAIVRIGSIQIDDLGKGTGTYPLPASGVRSGPGDEAAVCVSHPLGGGFHGNMVPVTIL